MRNIYFIMLAALVSACSSNGSGANETQASAPEAIKYEGELAVHEVPLPIVPDSLTRPSQRADYMMLHFWDGMDFNNKDMVSDTLLVEQTFSNFIEILPRTSSEQAVRDAVRRMYEQAAVNPDAVAFISAVAEKYLYDQDSPFRNLTLYQYFKDAAKDKQNN